MSDSRRQDDLASKITDDLGEAPARLRLLRLWLSLHHLMMVTDFLPVFPQRNVPTIDTSSRYDQLCLRFEKYNDFYLVIEMDGNFKQQVCAGCVRDARLCDGVASMSV